MHSNEIDIHYFLEKLKSVSVFSKFDEEQIKEFIMMSRLKLFKKGETIIQEGAVDNWIYILISGSAKLVKKEQTLGVFKRVGDIFGEMRIIDVSPRSASIVAESDATCLGIEFPGSKADKSIKSDHPVISLIIYQTFAEILAERLRNTTEELVKAKKEIELLKTQQK